MKTRSLTTLIVLIVIAAALLVGYYFEYSYVSNLSSRTGTKMSDLSYVESKYAQALSLSVVANSGESDGKKLDAYLINKGEEISVVKDLERLAASLALISTTESIDSQPEETLAAQNKDFLHIVMSTRGTQQQTRRFLSLIETLPFNVKVNAVHLYDTGADAPAGRWQGRFDISIVKEKDNAVIQ